MEPGIGGDTDDTSDNSDFDLGNNKEKLPKKKLTNEQLLHKYIKAIE